MTSMDSLDDPDSHSDQYVDLTNFNPSEYDGIIKDTLEAMVSKSIYFDDSAAEESGKWTHDHPGCSHIKINGASNDNLNLFMSCTPVSLWNVK